MKIYAFEVRDDERTWRSLPVYKNDWIQSY